MKTLTKLALAAVILCSVFAANAQSYYRNTTYGYGSSYGNSYGSCSSYSQPRSSSYTANHLRIAQLQFHLRQRVFRLDQRLRQQHANWRHDLSQLLIV